MRSGRVGHVTRAVALALLVGTCVLGAACSLTTSLSGLSGGSDETGAPMLDGSLDATFSGNADAGRFCERNASALFCADFDDVDGGPPKFGFDSTYGNAQLGLTPSTRSAPSALRARVLGGTTQAAGATKSFVSTKTHAHYALDLRAGASCLTGGSYHYDFAKLSLHSGSHFLLLEIAASGTVEMVEAVPGATAGSYDYRPTGTSTKLSPDTWVRLDWDIRSAASGSAMDLSVDGVLVGHSTITFDVDDTPSIGLFLSGLFSFPTCEVVFDNVTFDLE